jgi:hypothetical protein
LRRERIFQITSNVLNAGDGDRGDGSWHIAANTTRALPIVAVETGPGSNTAAGTINTPVNPIANLVSLTNQDAINTGEPAADNATFRQFFRDYLASLNRGTRPAILAALRSFTASTGGRIFSATIEEWDGITQLISPVDGRRVSLIIHIDGGLNPSTPEADTATPELVDAARRFLLGTDTEDDSGQMPAGVPWVLVAAKAFVILVGTEHATVVVDADQSLAPELAKQLVANAILTHFAKIPVSGTNLLGDAPGTAPATTSPRPSGTSPTSTHPSHGTSTS